MQQEVTPAPRSVRAFPCSKCSDRNQRLMRTSHVYVEYRSSRQAGDLWECMACGHRLQLPAGPKIDPETENLHSQWRVDNENITSLQTGHGACTQAL